jgi:IS1 family transposase
LDKARDINCPEIIRILADYQVTIEFVHSILAYDWERVSLIHQYESQFIKMNLSDSIHTYTWLRTTNRTYSKNIIEFCLETNSSELFELLFNSPTLKTKIDVNIICTDGLPFYFHMFNKCFSSDIQKIIFLNSNFHIKSSKGETFLFHLVHLYDQNENKQYFDTFKNIITNHPLLITHRNEHGRTIIDEIELTSSLTYHKLRIFYDLIKDILFNQLKNNNIERYILSGFGYHLLLLFNDENLQISKSLNDLLRSLKCRQGLSLLMTELAHAISDDDLGKIQNIFKIKTNISFAKDWLGRTCAHLAVLYRRRQILKYKKK